MMTSAVQFNFCFNLMSFNLILVFCVMFWSMLVFVFQGSLKSAGTVRHQLSREWASVKRWAHYQPLDQIRDYFGEKFAIYFAWLGFYTNMLILPSIVGILCFIYGCATVMSNQLRLVWLSVLSCFFLKLWVWLDKSV